jgi:hypothetical protein
LVIEIDVERAMFENFAIEIERAEFLQAVKFNEMNQYHNCIQDGKLGWKEGAD